VIEFGTSSKIYALIKLCNQFRTMNRKEYRPSMKELHVEYTKEFCTPVKNIAMLCDVFTVLNACLFETPTVSLNISMDNFHDADLRVRVCVCETLKFPFQNLLGYFQFTEDYPVFKDKELKIFAVFTKYYRIDEIDVSFYLLFCAQRF